MVSLFVVVTVLSLAFMAWIAFEPWLANAERFSDGFQVACPERHTQAWVELHTAMAAISSADGVPALQIQTCNLLRPNETCGEECLRELAA